MLSQPSPTLDLINDCFRFVTGFFEVIRTSAPHIYHSALFLSPRMSTIWKLYQPLSRPLTRVIQGIPTLWDSCVGRKYPQNISTAVWSPCSRFIAICLSSSQVVEILDAVTLEKLYTLSHGIPICSLRKLVFSTDGHLLMGQVSAYSSFHCVNWDLQTGGQISNVDVGENSSCWIVSASYSRCGTMFGVLGNGSESSYIYTYNVLSGRCISTYKLDHYVPTMIWTHSENSAPMGGVSYGCLPIGGGIRGKGGGVEGFLHCYMVGYQRLSFWS